MKLFKHILFVALLFSSLSFSQRLKDISYLSSDNSEQIIGYGLVIGLAGTGDSHRSQFTMQSITSMLKRFGITVPQTEVRTRNVAAVMVTASLPGNSKTGFKFDVVVSSLGDAKSLAGGTLLLTPLSSSYGDVYAFAQGPISVGGFDVSSFTGNRVAKNHTQTGRVPLGGSLKESIQNNTSLANELSLFLKTPDLSTANNILLAINAKFGEGTSTSVDGAEVRIKIPTDRQNDKVGFLAELESIEVQTDYMAKVILNERTGTVVAGEKVQIKPVSITHGSLNITIQDYPIVSQPGAFSKGSTVVVNNAIPYAAQDSTSMVALNGASNVQEVAAALNSLKVTPKDIISIFQALKEAGALIGELVIL